MPRQPKPRFTIDEKSMRGLYSRRADVRSYTILIDGLDHGIVLRTGDYDEGSSAAAHGETVVEGLRSTSAVLEWLKANLIDLPPVRHQQFEMEI